MGGTGQVRWIYDFADLCLTQLAIKKIKIKNQKLVTQLNLPTPKIRLNPRVQVGYTPIIDKKVTVLDKKKKQICNCFRFLFSFSCFQGKKKKINFFLFSKWKTRSISCFEKHIFQKQNSRNLFGSCFWKGEILFSLVNFFF